MNFKKFLGIIALIAFVGLLLRMNFTKEDQKILESFKVSNTDDVEKIVIQNGNQKTELSRFANVWLLNERFNADYRSVAKLLEIVKYWDVTSAVPASIELKVREELLESTKVILYDKDNKVMECFFIGDTTADGRFNYIMKCDEMIPHFIYLSTLHGDLSKYFSADWKYWRSLVILAVHPDLIKKVCISYPNNSSESFCLSAKNGRYFIDGQKEVRQNDAVYLLSQFELKAEKFIDDPLFADKIAKAPADFVITITTGKTNFTVKGVKENDSLFYGLVNQQAFVGKYKNFQNALQHKSDLMLKN